MFSGALWALGHDRSRHTVKLRARHLSRHGLPDIYDVASAGQSIQAPPDLAVEQSTALYRGIREPLRRTARWSNPRICLNAA